MELVIALTSFRGLEENFEAIIEPSLSVAFGNVCLKIPIFKLGPDIQVLVVPQKFCLCSAVGVGSIGRWEPRGSEVVDQWC
jgi:hypothetical protein